jgi:hypothetical protein
MLLLASVPFLLIATWLISLAGAPRLAVATLTVLALAQVAGAWVLWQSKP